MSKLTDYRCACYRGGVGESPITFDRAHFEQKCQDIYRATQWKSRSAGEWREFPWRGTELEDRYDLLLELSVLIGGHGPRFNVSDDHGAADTMRFIRTNRALKKWCIATGNSAILDICHRAEQPFQPEARQVVLDSFAALSPAAQREARWLASDSAPVWE